MASIQDTANLVLAVQNDPSRVMRVMLDSIEDALDGKYSIVTASNPFIAGLEADVILSVAEINRHEAIQREIYPELATGDREIYRHMSDTDYLGRFGAPGSAPFTLVLSKDEIKNNAIQVGDTGVKKIVIPKNSYITVAGVTFSFMYPLEIRVMSHGGLQLVWDVDIQHPLQQMTSNFVTWAERQTSSGETLIVIDFTLNQFKLVTDTNVITNLSGFNKTYIVDDNFWYCRAYTSSNGVNWTECLTTHSDQTFNEDELTVTLQLLEGKLNVSIPQIYISNGLASGQLRVDIYSTKGEYSMMLSDYAPEVYQKFWEDYDSTDSLKYSNPLSKLHYLMVFSDGSCEGGSNQLSFKQLKKRVVQGATQISLPVTPVSMESKLESLGYGFVSQVDNLGTRIFLATRALPNYTGTSLNAGANCTIESLITSIGELAKYPTVADNGTRVTIRPETLFKFENGITELVGLAELAELNAATDEALANTVNTSAYMFTPFYYVVDRSDDRLELRGYHLNDPEIISRHFVYENDTAEIEVATGSYSIEKTESGYRLLILTKSGASYQALKDSQVHCQLAFKPIGEDSYAFMNGTLYGLSEKERVWSFDLTTNYDVTDVDGLVLNSFHMFENDPSEFATLLSGKFRVYHMVSGYTLPTLVETELDAEINDWGLPNDVVPVVKEELGIRFGSALTNLWSNCRPLVGEEDYLRYDADIPALWERTEYVLDPATGFPNIVLDAEGNQTLEVKHAKGSPVLDAGGNPVMAHQKGEIKYENGEPVVISRRGLKCELELFFLEGVFHFTTHSTDLKYLKTVAKQLINYLEGDISELSKSMLEETHLYYHPRKTLGQTKVLIDDKTETYIPANLSFKVKFYLPATSYANSSVQSTLKTTAKKIINELVSQTNVSVSEINEAIREALGVDKVPVDITMSGDGSVLTNFTLYDDSSYCSVKRVLKLNPNSVLQIEDDIDVSFVKHGN